MSKKIKELLDEFHYHEVMDRTYIIAEIIDQHLVQHPVFKAEKEFAEIQLKLQALLKALT